MIPTDFPLDNIKINDTLHRCEYTIFAEYNKDRLCFDFTKCRNPTMNNLGDFCYAAMTIDGTTSERIISRQSCCIGKCEEDDQVTCTWSISGKEYSGK